MNYSSLLKNKTVIKTLIVVLSLVILLLFRDAFTPLNLSIEKVLSKIKGETEPDSNIVLIHISESDLENIGPWPIKRSYYALLINQLTSNNVKAIGLEVFLSAKFISQTIYDNLLTNEIIKSNRVTLSSVSGNIEYNNKVFITDSLSYPSPKLLDDNIKTGHINYFQDPTSKIPLKLKTNGDIEKTFSYQLLEDSARSEYPNAIDINFVSSWKNFKNYSLLEFYDLIQGESDELKRLKDKIIIIGVSDLHVTQGLETNFDEKVPAFIMHAFALDNLIHKRYFRSDFKIASTVVITIILLILIWLQTKVRINENLFLLAAALILFVVLFVLHSFFYLRLDYWAVILPAVFVFLYQFISKQAEKKLELEGVIDETRILKSLLVNKESQLSNLQKELERSAKESSEQLIEKIRLLKDDISRLKENEADKEEAEIATTVETRNFHGIVYRSKVMNKVAELIQKAAPEDATVLILGESGTGKELVARAIHSLSKRSQNNFIAVNCGAISETLLESELFGHVKGSFTGALADKVGRFEAANNGTIFLDEVAETSENFQVKLLRVLQSGEFEKVGSSKTSKVSIRVIAATNKKLELAVKERKFREDLFYRLNVIRIDLPPLRDRKEDIESLARHFLNMEAAEFKISKAVLDALLSYKWNGNVRELESVIKRAVIFAKSDGRNMLQLNDLPDEIVKGLKLNFEDLVIDSLRQKQFSHSSIVETAKELGDVNRTLISENLRGLVFKILTENNFDVLKTSEIISNSNEAELNERVKTKIDTFLSNIKESLQKIPKENFDLVKIKLSSKYKNLPQKFHVYLDEVIKHHLK
jgi:transcriptional regulator with PAS, ATPase and Fis domain/CHASE2 domain-containing sensor protein